MAATLNVLIVEDNELDAILLVRELKRGGYEVGYERVDTPEAMTAALGRRKWDLVISDFAMPRFSAPAALALVKARGLDLPFVIVSGTVGEEVAVEAMRAGAHDFMAKAKLTRLLPAIARELREAASRAERAHIEQQLQRSQKMEVVGQLTGGLAHDFNNLLGVIVGNLDLLREKLRENPDVLTLVDGAMDSALRGSDLTRRLLALARRQPVVAGVVDLSERLPNVVAMLRRTLPESIRIETRFAAGLWQTLIDGSQADDALLNLAVNARDAMPNGGALIIETANCEVDAHRALMHGGLPPGDYVVLSVTDTGTGMPPDVLERAMEPFFTTKERDKGTGLGLSMVYGFAKQSSGQMTIYSEVGVGTTVRLYLPRSRTRRQDTQARAAPAAALLRGGERVLVVDDNAAMRRAVVRQLAGLGYRVAEAGSGPEALAAVKAGHDIDLLLTDVGLPEGMTGYELAAQLRQAHPGTRVLFMTGYGPMEASDPADAAGAQPMLSKPFRAQELATRIRSLLDEGR